MKTFKTILDFKRPLVILLSALSLLAACKKDSDSHPAPVTTPLSVVAAKVGDTIKIQGTNFSEDVNQVKVSFNGVAGTVVSATATEIVVVIPEGATSGSVTVTVYGNTVNAGNLTISSLTLYTIRGTTVSQGNYTRELVGIDPATATVSTILDLSTLPDNFTIGHLHYLSATNEIVGLDYSKTRLMKINVVTKKATAVNIDLGQYMEYDWLEVDKAGNMYTVGMRNTAMGYAWTITQIDPATGKTTALATYKNSLQGFNYNPATNELVSIADFRLQKYNITSKDTSSVQIATTSIGSPAYENIGADNNSNLYAFKVFYSGGKNAQIVKLNPVTGAETLVTTLNDVEPIFDLLFLPKTNELISIYKETTLYKYNLGTNTTTMLPLTSASNVGFDDPTSN